MTSNEEKSFFRKYLDWRKARIEKKKKEKPETFSEIALSWVKTILGAIIVVMIINGLAIASFVVPTGSMENTVMTGDFLFVNKFVYGPSTPQVIPFFNIPLPYYSFPGVSEPEKGDVIVFIYPGDKQEVEPSEFQYYLKRCVAVAGDTLRIINKRLFVNGVEFPMPEHSKFLHPINDFDKIRTFPAGRGFSGDNYGPLRIPKQGDVININPSNYREWTVFIRREGHETALMGQTVYIDEKPATEYVVERDYCFGMGDNRDNSEDSRYWGFIPVENVVGTPIIVYWSWDTNLPFAKLLDKITSVKWGRIGTLID
ncbi:signal peptidase I [Bacteroidota bacterium]